MSGRAVELSIITPAALFYSGRVELVQVMTLDGEEGFKAGHSWCVKLLAPGGRARLREAGGSGSEAASGNRAGGLRTAALKGGHIDIKDRFVIYAEDAAWIDEKETVS